MLDIKRIRKETEYIQELLNRKGKYSLSEVLELDETRREFLTRVEQMKARQNKVSKQIPALKKEGKDTKEIFIEMKQLSDSIKEIDTQLKDIENRIEVKLLNIPNIPSEDVPIGEDEDDNEVIESWGDIPGFGFEPQAHWDLGVNLDILDFERAVKLSGARFSMYKGMGAKLHRALSAFMLDIASKNGYREIVPPLIVTRDTMQGTGQLPKFEDDAFSIDGKDMFLIPTAEVPLANIYANEIVSEDLLPINFTAYTSCFRREAGSAGRDTRGIIRNHQFEKVELVKVVKPENSYLELERLLSNAREVLELLGLPYRVIKLCTGDLSFSASMTYDLEVYMPSYSRYLEISSCSNCVDYQARRMNLRFRDSDNKVKVAHTLNGSALAIGRTVAAIIENYQNEDGSITIPKVLVKYMSGVNKIESKK